MANDATMRSRMFQDSIADGLTKFFDTIPHDPNHYISFSAIQDGIIPFLDAEFASDPRLDRNLLFLLASRFCKIYRQGKPACFRRLTKEEIVLEKQQQKLQKALSKSASVGSATAKKVVGADPAHNEQAVEIQYVRMAVDKYFDKETSRGGKYLAFPGIRIGVTKYLTHSHHYSDEVLEQLILVALRQDPILYQERPNYYQFRIRRKEGGRALPQQKEKVVDDAYPVDSPSEENGKVGTKSIAAEAYDKGKELMQVLKSKSIGGFISSAVPIIPPPSSSSLADEALKGLPLDSVTIEDSFFNFEPRPNMPFTTHIVHSENIDDIESVDTSLSTLSDMINDELVALDRIRGYHSEEEYWQWLMTKDMKHKTLPVLPNVIKHVEPVIDTSVATTSPPQPPVDHWHMKNVTTAQMNNASKLFQCRLLLHIS